MGSVAVGCGPRREGASADPRGSIGMAAAPTPSRAAFLPPAVVETDKPP